jgi:hypothetical protein
LSRTSSNPTHCTFVHRDLRPLLGGGCFQSSEFLPDHNWTFAVIAHVPVRIQLSQLRFFSSFHIRTDVEMSDGKSAWPGCFRWRTGSSASTFQAIVLGTKNHWLAGSRINLRARSVALKKQMETCQSPSVDPASSTPCPRSRNSHTANPRPLLDNDSDFLFSVLRIKGLV